MGTPITIIPPDDLCQHDECFLSEGMIGCPVLSILKPIVRFTT